MNLMSLVRRSLRQHALSSFVTIVSVGLAAGLTMSVFAINAQTYDAFTGGKVGFDAVLGARGSQLQLVLNTVFHLETSPGNIPWSLYKEISEDPRVTLAIPYAVGDNYQGYRIVGTTQEMFTKFTYREGQGFVLEPGGRVFDESKKEAILGNYVAEKLGMTVGSTFTPYHGLQFSEREKHQDEYTVVAIMEPTNGPSDRVVWIPIEGIYRMSGHVLRGAGKPMRARPGEVIAEENLEVSAVMLKLRNPQAGFLLNGQINQQGKVATLAWPIARVMAELFDRIGWVSRILTMVAYLIVVVAAGSILASIYNTMNERRREFAILRALGARRSTVFSAIVLEASTITTIGALLGFLVYGAILAAAFVIVRAQTGVVLDAFRFDHALWMTPVGMILLGALAGLVPAFKAYRTDVASNLTPLS
ncbi:MAG: FtsX-like permease family protein [Acidobacteria bacterium]|nr:FtsX-like permease family protein [Acidobacteriota bacterium]